MNQPAGYMDDARLALCFDGGLGAEACGKLRRSARLQGRLSALVEKRFGLLWADAAACGEADRSLALASPESFARLALASGAVYWSAAIANVILAREAEAINEEIGSELCAFALASRSLAGPQQSLEPLDGLGGRILQDGWGCVAAWRLELPEGAAQRVRLKLPPMEILDRAPGEDFVRHGPAVVRRAAEWLA